MNAITYYSIIKRASQEALSLLTTGYIECWHYYDDEEETFHAKFKHCRNGNSIIIKLSATRLVVWSDSKVIKDQPL